MIERILVLATLFGVCGQMAAAQTPITNLPPGQSFITTTGQGMVTAAPDLAYINTTVITNDADAATAISANAAAYQTLHDRTQASGVASADIQQISYNVQDVPRPSAGNAPPPYAGQRYGYTVSRGIRITVHDVSRGQQIAEAVASSGASGYTNVSYSLSDENQRLQQQAALRSAVAQAHQDAEAAARAAGLRIVRLHVLQVGQTYPVPMGYPAAPAGAYIGAVTSSISVPPAQVQVRASVTATYLVSAK